MKQSRQIIHGIVYNNIVTIVEMAVGLFQQVLIVRFLLGLKQYGSLAFFQAGFGLLAMFFNLNLNYSAIRFGGAAQGKNDEQEFYRIQGTTFFLTILLNLLLLLITVVLYQWGFQYKGKVVGEYYFLLALNTIAALPAGFAGQIFTTRKQFKLLSIQQIMSSLLGANFILMFAYFQPTVKGAIYGMIAGSAVVSAISLMMVWKDLRRCRIDLRMTKDFGVYGGQFALTSIIKQFFWKADVIILGLYVSERAVGIYRIAQTVANPLMRVFSPLWTVLFPTVSTESGAGKVENIKKLLFRGTQWLVVGNLPIVVVACYLAEIVVPRIYGVADAAVFPIRILLWGYAIGTMTSVSPPILRVYRNDLALFTTLAAAILNIALNLILIPRFQINGAALANFISFGLLALAVYWYAFRSLHIQVLPLINGEVLLQIVFISLIMACSILNYFWVALALFAGMLAFLYRYRVVTVSEFKAYLAS
jgi:O-antigen/teichoic acid export membrane protein